MKKVSIVLLALVVIFSLSCISLMADEVRERSPEAVERDRDPDIRRDPGRPVEREYEANGFARLAMELERQRAEIQTLKEEVRSLREQMLQLIAEQINRQWEEMNMLREMLHEQHNFMREMMKVDQELKMRQIIEMRGERPDEEHNIEMELRHLEEEVKRNPGDPEIRLKLGHVYREVDNPEAAFKNFKAALEIAPDFHEAFEAMEELRMHYPDISRIPIEKRMEDAAGEVISANEKEINLRLFEGEAMTFRVPYVQNEVGEWVLNDDFAHFAGSLELGMKVKILWEEEEGHRTIRKIERLDDK